MSASAKRNDPGSREVLSPAGTLRANLGAIVIMLAAVGLQTTGAVVLKVLADHRASWALSLLALGVSAVILVNLARLAVWGLAHRRYPISSTFPLSSLFYPVMLVVALAFGDEVGPRQIAGALLITAGTVWLSARVRA